MRFVNYTTILLLIFAGCLSKYANIRRNLDLERYAACRDELLALDPQDAQGLALLAESEFYLGDFPLLVSYTKRSLEVSSEYKDRLGYFLQKAYLEVSEQAVADYFAGDNKNALGRFEQTLEIAGLIDSAAINPYFNTQTTRLLALAGECALQLEKYTQANEFFERLRRLQGSHIDILEKLAYIAFTTGDYKRCLELCSLILKQDATHSDALVWRAQAVEALGDKEILNAYLDALKCGGKEYSEALQRNAGMLLYELGETERARKHLLTVLHDFPQEQVRLNLLIGESFFREGKYKEAAQYFTQAAKANPTDPNLLRYLGASLWFQEKYDEAKVMFDRSDSLTSWLQQGLRRENIFDNILIDSTIINADSSFLSE